MLINEGYDDADRLLPDVYNKMRRSLSNGWYAMLGTINRPENIRVGRMGYGRVGREDAVVKRQTAAVIVLLKGCRYRQSFSGPSLPECSRVGYWYFSGMEKIVCFR
jgi:hypothetical protein